MKINGLLILGLIFIQINCTYDSITEVEKKDCSIGDIIKSKDIAKTLIIGKWNWKKTTYTRRGAGITTETPLSTGKTLTFEFTEKKVRIIENNDITEDLYEIIFLGEGSNTVNTVDDILAVRFFKLTGEFKGTSMFF